MGKILKVLILCLSFSLAYAELDHYEQLGRFDAGFEDASDEEVLRFHHSLKNSYIHSIIKNDLKLKIKSLQRLIKTSRRLNLSSSSYEKELQTLQKMTWKKGFPVKKLKLKEPPKQDSRSFYEEKSKLLKIQKSSSGISLIFNENIEKLNIKHFVLRGQKYRYVYDIPAILIGNSKIFNIPNVESIKVVQYNKKTIRVVFTDKKKIKFHISKIDNSINIGNSQLKPKKTHENIKIQDSNQNYSDTNSKIVVIDAGHGGKDGGAIGYRGLSEKKVVLKIALKLGSELKKLGYKVFYTRTNDLFIQLRSRTNFANQKMADIFISIHANAAPNPKKYKSMYGVESFFLSPAKSQRSKTVAALENKSDIAEMDYFSKQTFLNFLSREKIIASNKLALDIQQSMLTSLRRKYKVKDGGVREAPFWVLVGAQMPAVLVEIGYITNPTEAKRMSSNLYHNLLVKGIARGISAYFDKNDL